MNRSRLSVCLASILLCTALSACGGGGGSGGDAARGTGSMEKVVVHQVTAEDTAAAKSTAPIASDSVVLWVNGMGCPLCASNIDKQLERVGGVQKVDVDLGQGVVTLALKPGASHPSPARLGEAVEDAGFTLVKVQKP